MNFNFFIDFLNCLYVDEVEAATRTNNRYCTVLYCTVLYCTRTNNRERLAVMGFSVDLGAADTDLAEYNRRQAQRWAGDISSFGKELCRYAGQMVFCLRNIF